IVDREGRIVVYLAGRPASDATWDDAVREASELLTKVGDEDCEKDFKPDQVSHQRGQYPILHTGYSHGGGPTSPYYVARKTVAQGKAVDMLKRSQAFLRIAGFASSAFQMGAPLLFDHYREVLADVEVKKPGLFKPFRNSVFPTATFNLGPQAVTLPHRDAQNVPYGWCAITALGNYNPVLGGHLYLWELKMVVEFPPGSTILVPSALITHGNTPIQTGEVRQSFTQYCSGSLMRWHAYGFRTRSALKREDPALEAYLAASQAQRKAAALSLFSKHKDLPALHAARAHPEPSPQIRAFATLQAKLGNVA
ncbi:hypothetical protein BV25DRAFT_1796690, partial [Artomyces pyxidatus]